MGTFPDLASFLNLLAVETSTELCSAALLQRDGVLVEESLSPNQHAEHLAPMIRRLLDRACLSAASLDAFAFGQGPGSFTGIRIACGIVQGLALGAGRTVVPVPSLMALAEEADASHVVVALDARMGEVYLAAYEKAVGDWHAVIEPCLALKSDLPNHPGQGWVATGSGFDAFDWLRAAYAKPVSRCIEHALPGAQAIARIAARRLARGESVDPESAAPLYLREKVALTTAERLAAK
jgi:tRNA threonylcarbamoyladenosine biosynthesis protein TsaB